MSDRIRYLFLAAIVAGGLFAPSVLAGPPPSVYSVSEGVDPATGRPTLSITGKGLRGFVAISLVEVAESVSHGSPDIVSQKSSALVLRLPSSLTPGAYVLTMTDKRGVALDLPVSVSDGKALPGSVGSAALDAALLADLADAATLAGEGPTYYRNADNLSAGTLSTAHFSAYGDLTAEGKVGTGASQLAHGDHGHDYTGDFAPMVHDHDEEYAGAEHDHAASYSGLDHSHDSDPSGLRVLGILQSPLKATASIITDPNNQNDTVYGAIRVKALSVQVPGGELSKTMVVWVDWRFKARFDEGEDERPTYPNEYSAFVEVGDSQWVAPSLEGRETILNEKAAYLTALGMTSSGTITHPLYSHMLVFQPSASQMEDGFTLDLYVSAYRADSVDTSGFDLIVERAVVLAQ